MRNAFASDDCEGIRYTGKVLIDNLHTITVLDLFKNKDSFLPLVCSNVIISTCVVAAVPLILVRPPEILRYVVLHTLGLIKVEEFVPLPVLHPSGIISSNQVILAHKRISPLSANLTLLLISYSMKALLFKRIDPLIDRLVSHSNLLFP